MAQLDDIVGSVMRNSNTGVENNTILVFTTDNGAENFSWPTPDAICRRKGNRA